MNIEKWIKKGIYLEVNREFEHLLNYARLTENTIIQRVNEFENDSTEDLTEIELDILSEIYQEYSESFPRILRSSVFTTSYSLLEYNVYFLCHKLHEKYKRTNDSRQCEQPPQDSYIKESRKYLKKVACIDIYKLNSSNDVNIYRIIRDAIVHKDGKIDRTDVDSEEARNFIKTSSDITLDDSNQIQIQSIKFCEQAINTLKSFFNEVLDKIWV